MQLPLMGVMHHGSNLYSKSQIRGSTSEIDLATKLQRTHWHFTPVMTSHTRVGT